MGHTAFSYFDCIVDVPEDFFDYRSFIIEIVYIPRVSRHHHRWILFFCE